MQRRTARIRPVANCLHRFRRWIEEGVWERMMTRLLQRLDSAGKIDRSRWSVDRSVIRAHRSASGMIPKSEVNDELNALGRSRGGYGTKLHVMVDSTGNLLAATATVAKDMNQLSSRPSWPTANSVSIVAAGVPMPLPGTRATVPMEFENPSAGCQSLQSSPPKQTRRPTKTLIGKSIANETSSSE